VTAMNRKPLDLEHRRPMPKLVEAVILLLAIASLIFFVIFMAGGR